VGFVNFKLYNDAGLVYPPRMNRTKFEQGADLSALHLELKRNTQANVEVEKEDGVSTKVPIDDDTTKARLLTLPEKLASLKSQEEKEKLVHATVEPEEDDMQELDLELREAFSMVDQNSALRTLFSDHVVFLSREAPRNSLGFVLRAFGVRAIGWDSSVAGGSLFPESDPRITLQICDRPTLAKRILNRVYVQPQWVYDSLNAGKLQETSLYGMGEKLPPHLSPFVSHTGEAYVAVEAAQFSGERVIDNDADVEDADDTVVEDDNEVMQREYDAETAGIPSTGFKEPKKKPEPKRMQKRKKVAEEQEQHDQAVMVKMMMSKKKQKLYKRVKREVAETKNGKHA